MLNDYEAKQVARRERLLERADKAQREADGRTATASRMAEAIPLGQPILTGHHSEGRDRRYRGRIRAQFEKGAKAQATADKLRQRAASVGRGGISSDDPDAVDKLRAKLAGLERDQETMKAANRALRRDDDKALRTLGFSDSRIAALKRPDDLGRTGFPDYALKNNNANIRRIRTRIDQLASRADDERTVALEHNGVQVVDNAEVNRVQIVFPGKPAGERRRQLKAAGYRWAPSQGAWQRHRSAGALHMAMHMVKQWSGA